MASLFILFVCLFLNFNTSISHLLEPSTAFPVPGGLSLPSSQHPFRGSLGTPGRPRGPPGQSLGQAVGGSGHGAAQLRGARAVGVS